MAAIKLFDRNEDAKLRVATNWGEFVDIIKKGNLPSRAVAIVGAAAIGAALVALGGLLVGFGESISQATAARENGGQAAPEQTSLK